MDYSFGIMDFAFFLQLSQIKNKMKINQLSLKADTCYIFIDFKALQYNRSEVFITPDFFLGNTVNSGCTENTDAF